MNNHSAIFSAVVLPLLDLAGSTLGQGAIAILFIWVGAWGRCRVQGWHAWPWRFSMPDGAGSPAELNAASSSCYKCQGRHTSGRGVLSECLPVCSS